MNAENSTSELSKKLGKLVGGSTVVAALAALPAVVDAQIVRSTTTPVSTPAFNATNTWDVDGDGRPDFALERLIIPPVYTTSNYFFTNNYFEELNGGRLAQNLLGIGQLSSSVSVGTSLGTAYSFGANADRFSTFEFGRGNPNWQSGDTGFLGFQFTSGSETFFGWAELTYSPIVPGTRPEWAINEAYYESTPGAAIQVGTVPEPSGLAVLGLLAAGAFARRRRSA